MISILVLLEVILLCLGGALLIHRQEYKVSESISSGIVLALLTLSFSFQSTFLIHQPKLSFVIEIALVIGTLILIVKKRELFNYFYQKIKDFISRNIFVSFSLVIAWSYLLCLALILPPSVYDSMTYNLARVLLFQQHNSLFLTDVNRTHQAVFPVGVDILHHAILRFYTDYGIGIFSFLAYISVVLGTYALCRQHTSQKISLAATLVIASLPEFVFQATSTKNDIFIIAAAIFCFLAVSRLLKKLCWGDLTLLLLGLVFGVSAKTTFMAFALPFCCFFGFLLLKKYGLLPWFKLLSRNWYYWIILAIPLLILSQLWLFIHNHNVWGTWSGPEDFVQVHKHSDGVKGAFANLVRYGFQSINFLPLTDEVSADLFNFKISEILQNVYDTIFLPLFDGVGAGTVFGELTIKWWNHEDHSWFGPWGTLIVLPAIIYSLFKGKKEIQAWSLSLLGYLSIVSYQVVWMPWNCRFISIFFAGSGVCIAYSLNSLRVSKFIIKILKILSILLLLYACAFNVDKRLVTSYKPSKWPEEITTQSIWKQSNFGRDRDFYFNRLYGDDRLDVFTKLVPSGSQVALVVGHDTLTYNFLLRNPDLEFTPMKQLVLDSHSQALQYDYILCLKDVVEVKCDLNNEVLNSSEVLWASEPGRKEAKLIRILP